MLEGEVEGPRTYPSPILTPLSTDMQQNSPHYSLSMRLFQAELITRRAKIVLGVARIASPGVYKKFTGPIIPIVVELAPAVDPELKFRSVDEYLRLRHINSTSRLKTSASPSPHQHFDNRIEAMVRTFGMAEVREGVRVVEDICQFADKTVHVLAKFRMNSPGEAFQLIHCVSRIQQVRGPSLYFLSFPESLPLPHVVFRDEHHSEGGCSTEGIQ